MIVLDCEQGSDEWQQARLGIPTASCFDQIITSTGKPSASVSRYMGILLEEYRTGIPSSFFESADMQNGTMMEPIARDYYSFLTGEEVNQVGLIYLDDRKLVSASPDGLIGKQKGIEIKCPKGSTQAQYLVDHEAFTKKYKHQIQGNLWISGRDIWEALSYCNGYNHVLIEIGRNGAYIKAMAKQVDIFIDRMLEIRETIITDRVDSNINMEETG